MIRKTILGLIRTDAGIQWVDIDLKSIGFHRINSSLISIKYFSGWKRRFRKTLSDKFLSETHLLISHTHFFPAGFENGQLRPEKTTFILGICDLIDKPMADRIELLEAEHAREDQRFCKDRMEWEIERKDLKEEAAELRRLVNKKMVELNVYREHKGELEKK